MKVERALFLPGASGVARFWQPVIDELALPYECRSFDYPGYGGNPPDPQRSTLAQLTDWIGTLIDRPVDVFAQSMGGAIALKLALKHHAFVQHLVLTGTTGGIRLDPAEVERARSTYGREASKGEWLSDERVPLQDRVANLPAPCLVIFGTKDPISPLAQGQAFAKLLPHARFVAIETDSHFFVRERPAEVAGHIRDFLHDTRSS